MDNDGNFLAVRGSNLSNLGGHAAAFVSLQKGLGLMSSVYRIPVGYFRGRGAVTNTVSTTPYRSAGRPRRAIRFAHDSPLEEDGFEPSVPRSGSMPESAGGIRRRFGKGLLTGHHFRKQPPGDRSERETVMGMAKGEP